MTQLRAPRRWTIGVVVGLVALLVGLGVALTVRQDTAPPTDPAGEESLAEWPSAVDFAGVRVKVDVRDAVDELMQERVVMGEGDAALNVEPSDAVQPGNPAFQRFQNRVWFTCQDRVVRMTEDGPAVGAPEFTIGGPTGRWLPAGALVEAARQLTVAMGCTAAAPEGTPAERSAGQSWLGPLAAAVDRTEMASCCAQPGSGFLNDWGILLPDGERLSLSVGDDTFTLAGRPGLQPVDLGDGRAVQEVQPSSPADVLFFACGPATVLAYPTSGSAASVDTFVTLIGCTPRIPPAGEIPTTASPDVTASADVPGSPDETSPATPSDVVPPQGRIVLDALDAADGVSVRSVAVHQGITTLELRAGDAELTIQIAEDDPGWDISADAALTPIADGEGVVLADGAIGFLCEGIPLTVTPALPDASALTALARALGCTPLPPGP